jgi:ribosomal protein S6
MKRTYELTLIVKSDFPADVPSKRELLVESLLGGAAKVTEVTLVGKRQLAYPIEKQKEAIYLMAKLTGLVKVNEIENAMKLRTDVLRFLLIAKEE